MHQMTQVHGVHEKVSEIIHGVGGAPAESIEGLYD